MKKGLLIVFVTGSLSLLSSCLSMQFSEYYTSYVNAEYQKALVLLRNNQEPEIYSSNNINSDVNYYSSNNYVCIGMTSFNGPYQNIDNDTKRQCRKVGATVAIYQMRYTHTIYNQNKPRNYTGNTGYGGGASLLDVFNSTVDLVNNIPVDRYDYIVYYFVKRNASNYNYNDIAEKNDNSGIIGPRTADLDFGIFYCDLTDYLKREIQREAGVYVIAVYENTPAFQGGVKSGDIIIKANSKNINNSLEMDNVVKSLEPGNTIRIQLLRDNRIMNLEIVNN
jgi:hypothetical protein